LNYPAEFFCHAQYKNGSAFIALISVKQVIFGITLFVYLKKYSETLKLSARKLPAKYLMGVYLK